MKCSPTVHGGFTKAALVVYKLYWMQIHPVCCSTLQSETLQLHNNHLYNTILDSDAASQDTLSDSSVECGLVGEGESSFPNSMQEVGHGIVSPDKVIRRAVLETCRLSQSPQESYGEPGKSNRYDTQLPPLSCED